MTDSRRKGADHERELVTWLRSHGWPYAERRLVGSAGPDINGCPGIAFEAKNAKAIDLAGWCDQAETQRLAIGADYAPVVIKRRGTTDLGRAYAVLPLEQLARLLVEAGYGAAPHQQEGAA